jgi:precorrin-2 dehydrogenase/sirohydrochlorin ferrochelatase
MDAFPAFFPLAGRTVVVAGSGPKAEAKARLLESSPARVIRLAGEAALTSKAYVGATLAFVGSDDESFIEGATAAARAARVPVNVTDRPELCDFMTPALVDRGEVVAAIGTSGASPMLATLLRQDLEARVPEGAGRVAALLRSLQAEVREALPEPHLRRAFLRAALAGAAAQAAMDGDMETARARLLQDLAKGVAPQGRVTFVAGAGPAERLTLAASRVLAVADVLIADGGVDPEVLALARRDAERLAPTPPEPLAELTRRGLHVVRVTAAAPDPAELRALAELGCEVGVAPVA